MARWRVAIESQPHAEFERELRNTYICVDADIVSMYTNPGSAAGYLGLRYYGAGSNANSDDFASAAFLSGGLAQFILFELEGRQSSVEPRLALPGQADEIQRGFQRARNQANLAYQQALRELRAVNEKAQALARSAAGDAKEQGKLTRSLREYIAAWLGGSSESEPGGLPAIEQALRFGELFAIPEGADESAYPERVVHVSHYRFGAPINDFLPAFELANAKALRQRARELQVDDRHLDRIVREIEKEDRAPSNEFQLQQLRMGTDAYAIAWLDSVGQHLKVRYPQSNTRLKLISGSERLAKQAPEHVVPPMALMRLYLRSRLKADGANPGGEKHPAIGRLRSSLDAVLGPLSFGDGRYSPAEYMQWCHEQSDVSRVRDWTGLREIDQSRLRAVVEAWRDVTNLLAASHTQYSVASRQSIVRQLEQLESTIPNVSSEQWLSVIARSLELAERELMANASRLSLLMITAGNRPASRNPPPLRLDFAPEAQEIAGKVIWQYSFGRAQIHRDKIDQVLRKLQPMKYLVLLLGGLLRCATGDWGGARSFFDMAFSAASDGDDSPAARFAAIEATYASAVAYHVGAQKRSDLDTAQASLSRAIALANAQSERDCDIRFETEAASIELIRLWAQRRDPMGADAGDIELRAKTLTAAVESSFFRWIRAEELDSLHDQYINTFCLQEMACTALQACWLSRYVLYARRLFQQRAGDISPPSRELVRIAQWLGEHSTKLRNDQSHASPMVTALVRINEVLARRLILRLPVASDEMEQAVALCEDEANKTIPLVDSDRFLFLRLLLREQALV